MSVTDELYHHGVMGMHWGVRNPETLERYARGSSEAAKSITSGAKAVAKATGKASVSVGRATIRGTKAAGKAVVSSYTYMRKAKADREANKSAKEYQKAVNKLERERSGSRRKARKAQERAMNDIKRMSDEELALRVNRMAQEQRLNKLLSEQNPDKHKELKNFAKDVAKSTAKTVISKSVNSAMAPVYKEIGAQVDGQIAKRKAEKNPTVEPVEQPAAEPKHDTRPQIELPAPAPSAPTPDPVASSMNRAMDAVASKQRGYNAATDAGYGEMLSTIAGDKLSKMDQNNPIRDRYKSVLANQARELSRDLHEAPEIRDVYESLPGQENHRITDRDLYTREHQRVDKAIDDYVGETVYGRRRKKRD